ncbi:type II secretion system F family protein [Motilimonas cestriensis]|uniref:Type II secretion system F family protein n=1 Tax=Motilimonas cestriensis TaxID=2742685 RepID=A0ABS8WHA0_9GAMM|nr:type II secretion system F family protein [Motilimonas cestriensis]MCE2596750.1 type II secretion system F family protein [Motilimonas cestriensis]
MIYLLIILLWAATVLAYWRYQQRQQQWQQQQLRYVLTEPKLVLTAERGLSMQWAWYVAFNTFLGETKRRKWQRILIGFVLLMPLVLVSNGMSIFLSMVMSIAIAVVFVIFAYYQLQQRAMDSFRQELPDVIDGLIRALRVGSPLVDVFGIIATQHQGVTARLFHQMHDELKVGQTLQEAMQHAAQRMPMPEFRFLTIVLSLQQETGGRLADVLHRLSDTLRARRELAASIQTITAESRNSAKVLAALPVFVTLVLFTTGQEHFQFLMTTFNGQAVICYVVISVALGLFFIRRMTQLKG